MILRLNITEVSKVELLLIVCSVVHGFIVYKPRVVIGLRNGVFPHHHTNILTIKESCGGMPALKMPWWPPTLLLIETLYILAMCTDIKLLNYHYLLSHLSIRILSLVPQVIMFQINS